jgi:hypothetical protein
LKVSSSQIAKFVVKKPGDDDVCASSMPSEFEMRLQRSHHGARASPTITWQLVSR